MLPAYGAALGLTRLLGANNLAVLLQVLGALAAGGAVFVWLALRMRVSEVSELVTLVARRLRPARP